MMSIKQWVISQAFHYLLCIIHEALCLQSRSREMRVDIDQLVILQSHEV